MPALRAVPLVVWAALAMTVLALWSQDSRGLFIAMALWVTGAVGFAVKAAGWIGRDVGD